MGSTIITHIITSHKILHGGRDMEKTYGVWNSVTDNWEADGLLTLEDAQRELEGIVENYDGVAREDLEIRED